MEIKINSHVNELGEKTAAFNIEFEGKLADGLGYDEMLGLISAICLPQERPCLNWLKTPEQVNKWREFLGKDQNKIQDVLFEETKNKRP